MPVARFTYRRQHTAWLPPLLIDIMKVIYALSYHYSRHHHHRLFFEKGAIYIY